MQFHSVERTFQAQGSVGPEVCGLARNRVASVAGAKEVGSSRSSWKAATGAQGKGLYVMLV